MSILDLFQYVGQHPQYVLYYFIGLPLLSVAIGMVANGDSDKSPYKELFMLIIYGVCIPGIFSLFLNIYLFLFEKRSVLEYDVYFQILPVFSMILTLFIIRRFVSFDLIPGFGKISGLMMMISVVIMILWLLDRFKIIGFTYMPFYYLLLLIAVLVFILNYGMKKFLS